MGLGRHVDPATGPSGGLPMGPRNMRGEPNPATGPYGGLPMGRGRHVDPATGIFGGALYGATKCSR
eukprot:4380706-Pyramimonas_sp.AAC.1